MAGWGAMMGLGQSLQQVGGMINDYNKEKTRNQLEMDRESRAEAREQRIHERNQKTFGQTEYEQDGEGLWWAVDKAKDNSVLDRRLAPKSKIDEFTRAERTGNLQETLLKNQVTTSTAEAGVAGELAGISVEGARAKIGLTKAQTDSAYASASNSRSAAAARGKTGGGSGDDKDARTADVSGYTLDSFFSKRDDDGNVIVDSEGSTSRDHAAVSAFVESPEYKKHTDKNVAAAEYAKRKGLEAHIVREDRTARGTGAGLPAEELEQFIKTGEAPVRSGTETATPSQVEQASGILQTMERMAITDVDSGKRTVEESAKDLEDAGYPRAAARLRARYGK